MEKVLVTGGGGFIGKALVQELVKRGIEVAVSGATTIRSWRPWGFSATRGIFVT